MKIVEMIEKYHFCTQEDVPWIISLMFYLFYIKINIDNNIQLIDKIKVFKSPKIGIMSIENYKTLSKK